jgi:hypothetical protein
MSGQVPCSALWTLRLGCGDDPGDRERGAERSVDGFWQALQIAGKLLTAILAQPQVKRLLSSDRFSVDGTRIEA